MKLLPPTQGQAIYLGPQQQNNWWSLRILILERGEEKGSAWLELDDSGDRPSSLAHTPGSRRFRMRKGMQLRLSPLLAPFLPLMEIHLLFRRHDSVYFAFRAT